MNGAEKLRTVIKRLLDCSLSHYKPLIGPLNLDITTSDKQTSLNQDCYGYQGNLPRGLNLVEMVFFTQLSRLATRDNICPVSIVLTEFPEQIAPSEEYFGRLLQLGEKPKITFSAEDANKPFITQNAAMWAFFENKFNQKLIDLDCVANTVARVRATLLESLPGGES